MSKIRFISYNLYGFSELLKSDMADFPLWFTLIFMNPDFSIQQI